MNERRRHLTAWTLIGLPILFHTVYEIFWKIPLRGIPEGVVDTVCVLAVTTGVFTLVRPFALRPAPRYKR